MQTGNVFGYDPLHRQVRTLTEPVGKFINRKGGGSNIRLGCGSTARQQDTKYEKWQEKPGDFFHEIHPLVYF